MAIVFMDGCDQYATTADVVLRYTGTTAGNIAMSLTAGRFGGGCIYPSSAFGPVNIPHTGGNAFIVGGAHSPASNNYQMLTLANTTSSNQTEISIFYNFGVFQVWRGGSTLLASSSLAYPSGVWHHIEVKATIADSGGSVELRVNGAVAVTYTGDTRFTTSGTAGVDRVHFLGNSTTAGAWDDMYILDTTGSVANNFLGDCRINTLAPTSDSSVQFTRSTGASNYTCIDEVRPNADSDYVESNTVGHKDVYGFVDLPGAAATVYGCQALTWMKKTDAATRTVRGLVVSGGVTTNGATTGLSTSYTPLPAIVGLDPATGAQWTPSGINSATGGFEIVS